MEARRDTDNIPNLYRLYSALDDPPHGRPVSSPGFDDDDDDDDVLKVERSGDRTGNGSPFSLNVDLFTKCNRLPVRWLITYREEIVVYV